MFQFLPILPFLWFQILIGFIDVEDLWGPWMPLPSGFGCLNGMILQNLIWCGEDWSGERMLSNALTRWLSLRSALRCPLWVPQHRAQSQPPSAHICGHGTVCNKVPPRGGKRWLSQATCCTYLMGEWEIQVITLWLGNDHSSWGKRPMLLGWNYSFHNLRHFHFAIPKTGPCVHG